jgi:hypothetical protein
MNLGADCRQQTIQSNRRDKHLPGLQSTSNVVLSDPFAARRETIEFVKEQRARNIRDSGFHYWLVRPRVPKPCGIFRLRLDMHSAPSSFIESLTDRIHNRVVRANVDVTSVSDIL